MSLRDVNDRYKKGYKAFGINVKGFHLLLQSTALWFLPLSPSDLVLWFGQILLKNMKSIIFILSSFTKWH